MKLEGWVVIWVAKHSDYPRMTSNICDGDIANRMAKDMVNLGHAVEIVAVCPAESLRSVGWNPECGVPPPGWRCTRGAGHKGPCAAVPA